MREIVTSGKTECSGNGIRSQQTEQSSAIPTASLLILVDLVDVPLYVAVPVTDPLAANWAQPALLWDTVLLDRRKVGVRAADVAIHVFLGGVGVVAGREAMDRRCQPSRARDVRFVDFANMLVELRWPREQLPAALPVALDGRGLSARTLLLGGAGGGLGDGHGFFVVGHVGRSGRRGRLAIWVDIQVHKVPELFVKISKGRLWVRCVVDGLCASHVARLPVPLPLLWRQIRPVPGLGRIVWVTP